MKGFAEKRWPAALLIAAAGLFLYRKTLGAPFVFDDRLYAVLNPWPSSPRDLLNLWPLRYAGDVTFALNRFIFGPAPFSFHLVNLLIHLLNAYLVFRLTALVIAALEDCSQGGFPRRARSAMPLLASLVFLVHPMNTQAVSYISQRYTSLAGLFYLSALVFYLRFRLDTIRSGGPSGRNYLLSLLFTVIAMKTKETAFTLPFMVLLMEYGLFYRTRRPAALVPFMITLVIIPVGIFAAPGHTTGADEVMRQRKLADMGNVSPYIYFITQLTVITRYLAMLFLPLGQRFAYYWPLRSTILSADTLAALVFLLTLLSGALVLLRRFVRKRVGPLSGAASIGVIWFFLALSVESSFIPIKDVIVEHRVYMPGIGIIISVLSVLFLIADRLEKRAPAWRVAPLLVAGAAVLAFSAATLARNDLWSDDLRLYLREVEYNPGQRTPHTRLGGAYFSRRLYRKALAEFDTALAIKPGYYPALSNRAMVRMILGDYDGAISDLREAARVMPGRSSPHYRMGVVYLKKGMKAEAKREFERALAIAPGNRRAKKMLLYLERGVDIRIHLGEGRGP